MKNCFHTILNMLRNCNFLKELEFNVKYLNVYPANTKKTLFYVVFTDFVMDWFFHRNYDKIEN